MDLVKKKPKIKAYMEELMTFDELQLEVILNLKKMLIFLDKLIEKGVIDKRVFGMKRLQNIASQKWL
jgi:hypothetical protein